MCVHVPRHSPYPLIERWLQVNPLGTTISGWVPWSRDRYGDEDHGCGPTVVGQLAPTHYIYMEEWAEEGQVLCFALSIEM